MPIKDPIKRKEYFRNLMRKRRTQQKGITVKPEKLNPFVIPETVIPLRSKMEPLKEMKSCSSCLTLEKKLTKLTSQLQIYQNKQTREQEKKRKQWRTQKKRQREKRKLK